MTRWLTEAEVKRVPSEDLPLAVLSFDYRNVVATLINIRRRSHYNHFMWYHRQGYFASQGLYYKEVPVKKYLKHHRLKMWSSPYWTDDQRIEIKDEIKKWLLKPRWKTRYDFIALLGQLVGLGGLIQNPLTRICSDYGGAIRKVDKRYNLKHPAPDQVGEWFSKYPKDYQVYGKYVRD